MRRIRADKAESSVSVIGALWQLASLKPGRHGRWRRARKKHASEAIRQDACNADERLSSTDHARIGTRKRYVPWLVHAITGLWIALLLSILAYAMIEGEAAIAQLDGLDFVTAHSGSP